jgi:plasmid stability protein
MTKTLTITLPDALEQALAQTAAQANQSTEELVLQLLTQNLIGQETPAVANLSELLDDPLLKLAGCITSDVGDAADRHDYYIGQAIYDEMHQND